MLLANLIAFGALVVAVISFFWNRHFTLRQFRIVTRPPLDIRLEIIERPQYVRFLDSPPEPYRGSLARIEVVNLTPAVAATDVRIRLEVDGGAPPQTLCVLHEQDVGTLEHGKPWMVTLDPDLETLLRRSRVATVGERAPDRIMPGQERGTTYSISPPTPLRARLTATYRSATTKEQLKESIDFEIIPVGPLEMETGHRFIREWEVKKVA